MIPFESKNSPADQSGDDETSPDGLISRFRVLFAQAQAVSDKLELLWRDFYQRRDQFTRHTDPLNPSA